MATGDYLYRKFISRLGFEATSCQDALLKTVSEFLFDSENDILVVNGYAGTGKTTAMSAVIKSFREEKIPCVLMAPTGRAAKVLSNYAGSPACTIHKHIYRQKSVGGDGIGKFSLALNEDPPETVYIVDEVSLIGIDDATRQSAAFGSGNLLDDLVSFIRQRSGRMIMVGDSAQLPPVGLDRSPALSRDFMAMQGGAVFSTLTTVVRQQKASGILHNATMLRNLIENGYPGEDYAGKVKFLLDGFEDVARIGGGDLIEAVGDAYDRYGEDETIILCRSNRRANRYNAGIRAMVQFKEEKLVRNDKLMIVKNCYQFLDEHQGLGYIANGDIAKLIKIWGYEERYGLHFAQARLDFPDYGDIEIEAKIILDTLESEDASLTYDQQNALYVGVDSDYAHISGKRKRYEAVREDPYFNALQIKYANAVTGHKSQGGQWKCVFIDNPLWQDSLNVEDLKWLYTAITRSTEKVYFVSFKDIYFE